MIKLIGTGILIMVLFVVGRHDRKMKISHKKIFDEAQTQMQEFKNLMKETKLINGGTKNVK